MKKIISLAIVSLWAVSSSALNWTVQVEGEAWETEDLNAVVYGNDVFVAAGDFGAAFISSDGVTWTENAISSSSSASFNSIVWDGSLFVAVGSSGIIFTSVDGVEWIDQSSSVNNNSIYFESVVAGNGLYVAVGWAGGLSGGHRIYTSPDAETWTAQTSPVTSSSSRLYAVAWGDNQFVAAGSDGTIMTSPDGEIWTEQTTPLSQILFSVAYINGSWFAGGGDMNAALITSTDGETWTQRTMPMVNQNYSSPIRAIVAFGDKVAAVSKYLYTSEDGQSWDVENISTVSNGEVFYDAAIGADIAVLVGQYGTTITTPSSELVTANRLRISSGKTMGLSIQNISNPVGKNATIGLTVPALKNSVLLSICDIQGRIVKRIFTGRLKAGAHAIALDVSNIASGNYFAVLTTDFGTIRKPMIVTGN